MAGSEVDTETTTTTSKNKILLLLLNVILLSIGATGTPLVTRLYFIHGGKRVWLASWLQSCAWPIITIPLAISYIHRRLRHRWVATTSGGGNGTGGLTPRLVLMKPFLFMASAAVGLLSGFDNFLYAYGLARLPVSTSSLIIASQLAFTAGFAFLLVNQRLTAYSINSVFLLTLGAVVLALHMGNDRPEGESEREYLLGFVMTAVAAVLYGLTMPLVELSYKKGKQVITYWLVLEYQLVMCLFATVFCTVGMLINKDFQVIPREAKEFGIGEFKYYMVLVWTAILSQFFYLGAIGVIFCASALSSGVVIAVMLPVTEVLAVIFYREKFQVEKGVSLALSIWGFLSYFYGELRNTRNKIDLRPPPEMEMNGHSDLP